LQNGNILTVQTKSDCFVGGLREYSIKRVTGAGVLNALYAVGGLVTD